MIYRSIMTAAFAVFLLTPCIAGASKFKDVLDTPAMKSDLASRAPVNGLSAAGKRVVAVGQRGHILYSDDNGKSWIQAVCPVSSDLAAVHFPTAKEGWAVGHDGVVLHSGDGGLTWIKQFDGKSASLLMERYYREHPPGDMAGGSEAVSRLMEHVKRFVQEGADKPFLDVWFENEREGFIIGAFNLIFRTGDGGKSWVPWFDRMENPGYLHLYSIKRIGRDLYISGEQGLVLKLDLGAKRFSRLEIPYQGTFFGITGRGGSVVAFGMRGNVYRSTDGGKSWQKVETGVQTGLTGGTVTEEGRIVLVSIGGEILLSADGGGSFKPVKADQPLPMAAVIGCGKDSLVLGGLFGIYVQQVK